MVSYEWMLAWRFLRAAKIQTFLILAGIIAGVAVNVFIASLISALQDDLINTTVGDSPHIYITAGTSRPEPILEAAEGELVLSRVSSTFSDQSIMSWQLVADGLQANKDIQTISPVINGSGFVSKGELNRPITIKGVQSIPANSLYNIEDRLVEGALRFSGDGLLIGTGLAEDLNINVGNVIQIVTGDNSTGFFTINGIFDFNNAALNKSWTFMDINRAQILFGRVGTISSLELQINEIYQSEEIAMKLKQLYPQYTIDTWQQLNKQLLTGLQSQSFSSIIIQVFVLISVTLGIASVLGIAAVQRSKQIGILKAIGATDRSVSAIFIYQGVFLGIIGSLLGCLTGILLIQGFLFGTAAATGVPLFNIQIELNLLLTTATVAITASILASVAPARRAISLDPIEVIRNG